MYILLRLFVKADFHAELNNTRLGINFIHNLLQFNDIRSALGEKLLIENERIGLHILLIGIVALYPHS